MKHLTISRFYNLRKYQCHWRIEKQTDSWDCHYRCSDWAVCGEQGRGVATVINFRFTNENESDRFQLRVCPNCGVNVYKQRSWSDFYAYLRLLVSLGVDNVPLYPGILTLIAALQSSRQTFCCPLSVQTSWLMTRGGILTSLVSYIYQGNKTAECRGLRGRILGNCWKYTIKSFNFRHTHSVKRDL